MSVTAGTQTRTIDEVIAARGEKSDKVIDLVRMDDDGAPQMAPPQASKR